MSDEFDQYDEDSTDRWAVPARPDPTPPEATRRALDRVWSAVVDAVPAPPGQQPGELESVWRLGLIDLVFDQVAGGERDGRQPVPLSSIRGQVRCWTKTYQQAWTDHAKWKRRGVTLPPPDWPPPPPATAAATRRPRPVAV